MCKLCNSNRKQSLNSNIDKNIISIFNDYIVENPCKLCINQYKIGVKRKTLLCVDTFIQNRLFKKYSISIPKKIIRSTQKRLLQKEKIRSSNRQSRGITRIKKSFLETGTYRIDYSNNKTKYEVIITFGDLHGKQLGIFETIEEAREARQKYIKDSK